MIGAAQGRNHSLDPRAERAPRNVAGQSPRRLCAATVALQSVHTMLRHDGARLGDLGHLVAVWLRVIASKPLAAIGARGWAMIFDPIWFDELTLVAGMPRLPA